MESKRAGVDLRTDLSVCGEWQRGEGEWSFEQSPTDRLNPAAYLPFLANDWRAASFQRTTQTHRHTETESEIAVEREGRVGERYRFHTQSTPAEGGGGGGRNGVLVLIFCPC